MTRSRMEGIFFPDFSVLVPGVLLEFAVLPRATSSYKDKTAELQNRLEIKDV